MSLVLKLCSKSIGLCHVSGGLSGLDPRPDPGGSVVNKMTVLPDSIIPSAPHSQSFVYYGRLRRMNFVELGTQLEYARISRMG